jgi:hypothetical protein
MSNPNRDLRLQRELSRNVRARTFGSLCGSRPEPSARRRPHTVVVRRSPAPADDRQRDAAASGLLSFEGSRWARHAHCRPHRPRGRAFGRPVAEGTPSEHAHDPAPGREHCLLLPVQPSAAFQGPESRPRWNLAVSGLRPTRYRNLRTTSRQPAARDSDAARKTTAATSQIRSACVADASAHAAGRRNSPFLGGPGKTGGRQGAKAA